MTAFPGGPTPATAPDARLWWVAVQDKAQGPYHEAWLVASIRVGVFRPDDLASPVGGSVWRRLDEWPAFSPACATAGIAGPTSGVPVPGAASPSTFPAVPPAPPAGPGAPASSAAGPSRLSIGGPFAGLLVGGAVGGLVGLGAASFLSVPWWGGMATGLITGGLAGALAAASGSGKMPKSPGDT